METPYSLTGSTGIKATILQNKVYILAGTVAVLIFVVMAMGIALASAKKESIGTTSTLRYLEKEAAQNRADSNFAQMHNNGTIASITDGSCAKSQPLVDANDSYNYLLTAARNNEPETAVAGRKGHISDDVLTKSLAGL